MRHHTITGTILGIIHITLLMALLIIMGIATTTLGEITTHTTILITQIITAIIILITEIIMEVIMDDTTITDIITITETVITLLIITKTEDQLITVPTENEVLYLQKDATQ